MPPRFSSASTSLRLAQLHIHVCGQNYFVVFFLRSFVIFDFKWPLKAQVIYQSANQLLKISGCLRTIGRGLSLILMSLIPLRIPAHLLQWIWGTRSCAKFVCDRRPFGANGIICCQCAWRPRWFLSELLQCTRCFSDLNLSVPSYAPLILELLLNALL